MADKKVSELDAITGADTAADDLFLIVDSSGAVSKKITRAELNNAIEQDVLENISITNLTSDLSTNGNDINFGDNDKARFGAGSDLQIYHDGSNSYVRDAGTGNLRLTSDSEIHIAKHNNEFMVRAYADGEVELYYDSEEKLATTSTGVDVTGTVTADGLTVDSSGGGLTFSGGGNTFISATSSPLIFQTSSGTERMRITGTGNVGINNTSPQAPLHIIDGSGSVSGAAYRTLTPLVLENNGNTELQFFSNSSNDAQIRFGDGDSNFAGAIEYKHGSDAMLFHTAVTERMRINSSGNVGIGVVPETFNTVDGAVQVGTRQTLTSFSNDVGIGYNHYYNSGWKYTNADVARRFSSTSTVPFIWQYAASGSADAAITWSEAMRIDSSGNVGIGCSPQQPLEVSASNQTPVRITSSNTASFIEMADSTGSIRFGTQSSGDMTFFTGGTSAYGSETKVMTLDSSGHLGLGNAAPAGIFEILDASVQGGTGQAGFRVNNTSAQLQSSTDSTVQLYMNDSSSSAGTHNYLVFRHQGTTIGDIDTTNNSTIRYNTFTGAHWGQFSDYSQPDIKLGTVMSTIDEMCNWTEFEYTNAEGETEKTDIAGTYEIGSTHTIYIDEDGAQATGTAISHDTSGRIAKVKVSDTAADRTVYGVFAGHYKDGDSSVESLGLGVIRISSGVTVANGDLLESAGDGTARPQTGDTADVIKSSTIAKVTSTTVSNTYDDGTYLVPCVLMAG